MGTPGVVAGINPVPLHLRRAQQRAGASSRSDGSSKLSAIFRSLANRQIMLTCGVLLLMVAYVMSRQKSDGSAGRSIVVAPVPTASNDISEGDSGSTYDDAPSEDEVQEVEVPVYQEVVQEEPEVVQEEPARPPPFSISEACSSADTVDAPTFGILVLRPLHQQETIAALKEVTKGVGFDATEIIVFKDGAGQFEDAGDLRAASWSAALAGPNHFVVFGSHFFSEADAWNRMVLTARAKLLLLVRGVDVPFLRAGWLEKAATIFMAGPHLGVLGLFGGEVDGHIYGAGGLAVETADPVSQQPLIYVKSVMFGPLMVRRAIFQRVGTFSTAPECIGFPASAAGNSHRWPLRFEQEFCIRCWRKGFHVAFTSLALEETCAVSQCPSALATQMQTGIPKEPLVGRVQLGSDSLPVPFNSHVPQQEIVLKPGKAKAAGGKGKHGAQPAKGKSSAQQPATKGRKSASDNDRILPVPLSLSKSARAADDDDDDDDDDEYEYDEVADMEEGRRKATEAAMARAASAAAQGPKRVFAPTTTPSKSAPARGGGKAGGKQAGGGRRGGDGGDGGPDKGEDGEPDKGDDDDGGDDDGDAGNDDKDDEEEWEKDHSWMDADEQRMSHRRLLQMRPGPGVGGPMTTGQMRMGPGNGGQMRSGLGNGGQRLGGGIVSSSMSIRPSQGAGPATGPATIGPTHRFIDGVAVPVDRGASRKTPAGGWQGGADRGAGTVGVVGSRVNPGGMGTGEPNVGRYANPLAKPGELARVPMQVRRAGPQGESSGLGFADASVVSHVESATAAAARALVRQQAADEEATRHIQVEEDDAVVGDGTWDEEEEARVEEARRQRAAVHKRALEKQLALEAAATEAPSEVLQREYEMEEAARRDQVMTQAVNHKKGDKSSSSDHAYESIARNVQKLNEGLEIIEANAPLPGGTWCCASHIRHPMSYQHEGVGPSLVVCTYKPPHATGAVTAGFLVRSFHVHSDHLLVLMQRAPTCSCSWTRRTCPPARRSGSPAPPSSSPPSPTWRSWAASAATLTRRSCPARAWSSTPRCMASGRTTSHTGRPPTWATSTSCSWTVSSLGRSSCAAPSS
eukprot:jgi/Mesvir1/5534/Mv15571-RA.2